MSTGATFEVIDRLAVDPRVARVYEMGWQSWSPTAVYPVSGTSARPAAAFYRNFYRPGTPAPDRGFQGEGLLAVDTGDGGPVHVFGVAGADAGVPSIRARCTGGFVEVSVNGAIRHVEQSGVSLYEALAAYADGYVARLGSRPPRALPPLWASWYQYFTHFTFTDLRRNLAAMDRLDLPVRIVRLDDSFQAGIGDWLTPSDGFQSLPGMVHAVLDTGREAGVWLAPFFVGAKSTLFADHPDWLVHDESGAPRQVHYNWQQECFALDTTHPAAREYLREVFTTYRSWGATYFMVDFLYGGAVAGRRHDDVDPIAAYRDGLALVRESIGDDAYLQACGAPMFPSIGYVDSMRVNADVDPQYAAYDDELANPGGESSIVSTVGRAFMHGRFWLNDPDCFIVRPGVERRELLADVVERYGGVRISSDGLDQLDEWGLETTRRLLVPSPVKPFDAADVPLEHDAVAAALIGRDKQERFTGPTWQWSGVQQQARGSEPSEGEPDA